MALEIVIILLLVVLNGLLAMSEIAILSVQPHALQTLAQRGNASAARALALHENPERLLATVQIGITLTGVLAGVFGGATLAHEVEALLGRLDLFATAREEVALGVVVTAITLLSLLFGELVPKRIALLFPARAARLMALPMHGLSVAAAPVVWLLSRATRATLRALGMKPETAPMITEEEILHAIGQGARSGIIASTEHELLQNVFRFGDRSVPEIMLPITEVPVLRIDALEADIRLALESSALTHFPVCEGDRDAIVGVASVRTMLLGLLAHPDEPPVRRALEEALFIPETLTATDALRMFRESAHEALLVTDEYGTVKGIVTLAGLAPEFTGIEEDHDLAEPVQRADGSWLVEGLTPLRDFVRRFPDCGIALQDHQGIVTIGGYVTARFSRIPAAGEWLTAGDMRIEVVDMDAARVDKLLVERLPDAGVPRPS